MTIKDQLAISGNQVEKVFAGMDEETWNQKPTPEAMTAKEMITHLSECLVACKKGFNGEEHDWGNYSPVSNNPNELLTEFSRLRKEVISGLDESNEKHIHSATDFMLLHETYHVGQMCLLRIKDPSWNAYSIYE